VIGGLELSSIGPFKFEFQSVIGRGGLKLSNDWLWFEFVFQLPIGWFEFEIHSVIGWL
jgi:hypothetical protein